MDSVKKNRLRLELEPEPKPNPTTRQYVEPDFYEPIPKQVRGSSQLLGFFFWVFFFLILAGAISFGVWWQFFREKSLSEELAQSDFNVLSDKRSLDQILERPYLPSSHASTTLNKCLSLYRENSIQRAFQTCEEFLNTPASDEEKSLALTVLGVIMDQAGRYPAALERLEKATNYDPNNFHAYYNMSLVFRHMGRMDEARKAAQRAREIAPNDRNVALLSGNLFQDLGDSKSAMEAYKLGLSSSPDDSTLVYNLALTQYKQGNLAEAITNFERAIQKEPGGRIAVLANSHLGKIYFDRDNWKLAEFYYRESVRLQPDNAQNLYNLGLVALKQGKKEESISLFKRALDSGTNDPEIYIKQGEALESLNMPSLALESYRKALAIQPSNLDALFAMGDLLYRRGDYIQAEEAFRKIISITPGDSYTEAALVNLGILLDEMQRYSEAISSLERVLELNPKNYNAYYNLGMVYLHSGQGSRAIQYWQKASSLETGKQFKARERIGDFYFSNLLYSDSIREFDSILKDNPTAYRIRLKLANGYRKLGQSKSAERELLQVLNESESGEEIKEAHKLLALVYSESKDLELSKRAREEAFRASHMDPKDMESRLILAKILSESTSGIEREKAIEELKIVVNSSVSTKTAAQAYNLMGLLYYKNEEYKKALLSFEQALTLDPSLTEAYDNKRAARASYEDSIGNRGRLN